MPSSIRREAQQAILDLRQCNVHFNDVVNEAGVDPKHLRKLFAAIDLPIPTATVPSPSSPKGPGHSAPAQEIPKPSPRKLPSNKSDIDKQAQMIRRQLEKEQREKEQREAEAKASELARQREAASEIEERRRRQVEVQAGMAAFQKKAGSLNLKNGRGSPGMPPTPISSTPVKAAIVQASPTAIVPAPPPPLPTPAAAVAPAVPKIPGLLLGQVEEPPSVLATGNTDTEMRDAPPAAAGPAPALVPAPPTPVPPGNPVQSGGASSHPTGTRRKRPIAADLYSEPTAIRRKFGAQRSSSLIIEVSEDEDDDSDAGQPVQGIREGCKSGEGSPLDSKRAQGPPTTSHAPNGADALRKKEAEIQRLKQQIMAAQNKKKKTAVLGMPTPITTPPVGAGPTRPPPHTSASKCAGNGVPPPAELTEAKQSVTPAADFEEAVTKQCEQASNKQRLKEEEEKEEEIRAKQMHDEKQRIAEKQRVAEQQRIAAEETRQRQEREEAARQLQEERERKKKQLEEIESVREKKRMAREKLKAEQERIKRQMEDMQIQEEAMLREEHDMDELQSSLTKELETIASYSQVTVSSSEDLPPTTAERQERPPEGKWPPKSLARIGTYLASRSHLIRGRRTQWETPIHCVVSNSH